MYSAWKPRYNIVLFLTLNFHCSTFLWRHDCCATIVFQRTPFDFHARCAASGMVSCVDRSGFYRNSATLYADTIEARPRQPTAIPYISPPSRGRERQERWENERKRTWTVTTRTRSSGQRRRLLFSSTVSWKWPSTHKQAYARSLHDVGRKLLALMRRRCGARARAVVLEPCSKFSGILIRENLYYPLPQDFSVHFKDFKGGLATLLLLQVVFISLEVSTETMASTAYTKRFYKRVYKKIDCKYKFNFKNKSLKNRLWDINVWKSCNLYNLS